MLGGNVETSPSIDDDTISRFCRCVQDLHTNNAIDHITVLISDHFRANSERGKRTDYLYRGRDACLAVRLCNRLWRATRDSESSIGIQDSGVLSASVRHGKFNGYLNSLPLCAVNPHSFLCPITYIFNTPYHVLASRFCARDVSLYYHVFRIG
jgi:hypothetical protein